MNIHATHRGTQSSICACSRPTPSTVALKSSFSFSVKEKCMPNNHNVNRSTCLAVNAVQTHEMPNVRFETRTRITGIVHSNFMLAILSSELRKQVLERDIALTC